MWRIEPLVITQHTTTDPTRSNLMRLGSRVVSVTAQLAGAGFYAHSCLGRMAIQGVGNSVGPPGAGLL